ncbi:MAG: hypothetical protein PHH54_04245 [Candidatus Nanoarchaeia archaeon]|nr:hypothetical protein [Candidatus Nanoarchaeia archaeon]MDD5741171.1 hypothetical protein [Candidatus Nanoarchaeia archaeon]
MSQRVLCYKGLEGLCSNGEDFSKSVVPVKPNENADINFSNTVDYFNKKVKEGLREIDTRVHSFEYISNLASVLQMAVSSPESNGWLRKFNNIWRYHFDYIEEDDKVREDSLIADYISGFICVIEKLPGDQKIRALYSIATTTCHSENYDSLGRFESAWDYLAAFTNDAYKALVSLAPQVKNMKPKCARKEIAKFLINPKIDMGEDEKSLEFEPDFQAISALRIDD